MGVTSLVLGIIALAISVFGGVFSWVGVVVGVVGIILGALAKKAGQGGAATAGLVMSIIAASLGLVFWLACAACVGSMSLL